MKKIQDYPVVGSSKRALILDIDGQRVFCSTSNYAYLYMNPNERWAVVTKEGHVDKDGRWFEATQWVAAYKPQLF